MKKWWMVAALAAMLSTAAHAQIPDYTDVWWNPAESGWGVTFTQNESFIFMTFFLYGPDRTPTWYTAQTTLDTNGNYSGPLYATTGPFFGGAFNPTQVTVRAAGSASFHPVDSFQGTLSFTADGFGKTSYIERQSLTNILVGGTYQVASVGTQSGCANPGDNGAFQNSMQLVASQTFTPNTIRFDFYRNGALFCTMQGPFAQSGKLMRMDSAHYTCTTGLDTRVNVSDILVTPVGIEGTWAAYTLGGCLESARFAGVLQ